MLCNLIVQMLNDVYGANKDTSEKNYWHHTNRYLAAIELHSAIARSCESRHWMEQARHSLSIDPDSIDQQVASLRLMPYFRANNLKAS